MPDGKKKILQKQVMMRRVILACAPCIVGSIYFFGWRSLAMIVVSCLAAFLAEYIFCRRLNQPVSEAVFVSAVLYALVMPPTVAWHVLIFGMLFAIVFGKMVFGGFGRNVFNPAISGRCFVYICFPVALTARWLPAASGFWGALGKWSAFGPEAITGATPMAIMKSGGPAPELIDLVLGRISGTMGVTSVLLVLIGGIYLFYTKTANRTLVLSTIITYAVLNEVLYLAGVDPVAGALPALFGGGFLFGAFFMVTDPVSAPKSYAGRMTYGILIAVFATIIRNFSVFNGGLMFSILLGNMFANLIDYIVGEYKQKKKQAVVEGRR
jgi:RnfABCDGE-type electron transport complex D subunit